MPTTPSEAITLLAALFGSITAGLLVARPLGHRRAARHEAADNTRDDDRSAPTAQAWPAVPSSGIWSTTRARRPW